MSSFSVLQPGPYPSSAPPLPPSVPQPYQQRSFSKPFARPATAASALMAAVPATNGVEVPMIYQATYSGIAVYEMMVNKINVMRRVSDDWLNATQLLKIANVDKPKRTKILERLINMARHEKVQGGYGKYQGTWITPEQAADFARSHGVEHLIRPLVEYDPSRLGVEPPTKEQALAAERQKRYTSGIENRLPAHAHDANDTYVKRISTTAYNALTVINKAGIDSRPPRPRPEGSTVSSAAAVATARRTPSQQHQHQHQHQHQQSMSQEHALSSLSQRSSQSMISDVHSDANNNNSNSNLLVDSAYGTQNPSNHMKRPLSIPNGQMHEPPRKRMRPSASFDLQNHSQETVVDLPMAPATPTEPNMSFAYAVEDDTPSGPVPLEPLREPSTAEERMQLSLLQTLFFERDADLHRRRVLGRMSGAELDWPIDEHCHTALHWAATLAQLGLVDTLVEAGASIFRVNGNGETALMRACLTTNNADDDTFHALLDVFGPTIVMRDARRRTVLHHIALSSGIPGREASTKYYLEALLGYVIRQPASRDVSFHAAGQDRPAAAGVRPTSLGRFIAEIVNAEDDQGDTALNVAARAGSRNIVEQLLEIGADANLPNRIGLRPSEFGVGEQKREPNGDRAGRLDLSEPNMHQTLHDSCQPILTELRAAYSEIESDVVKTIRHSVVNLHQKKAQLRDAIKRLHLEREREDRRRRDRAAKVERRQRTERMRRAINDCRARLADNAVNGDVAGGRPTGDPEARLPTPSEAAAASSTSRQAHARLQALVSRNADLQDRVDDLHDRSFESVYARIVSLATGSGDHRNGIDNHSDYDGEDHDDNEDNDNDFEPADRELETLTTAVQSEGAGDVEISRVRGFLRKIREVEGSDL